MKYYALLITLLWVATQVLAQPNDCNEAVPGCTMPQFQIAPNNPSTNVVDFGVGTFSNPSTNPNNVPGNAGCLLTGETSSTFITINVVSSGSLAWSIQGPNGGCFDWIMWPYSNANQTCAQIAAGTTAPVSCNWNAPCQGFTGMANPNNLPSGGNQGNFESELQVLAGETYLLCLSNFSGTSQNVDLNFFGTAGVACGVSAPDKTICQGSSTTINVAAPGYVNPIFTWLNTTGVSNPNSGTNVVVSPTSTTTYQVKVVQPAAPGQLMLIDTATFTVFVETPPTPNAGLDDSICFGQPIALSGSVTDMANFRSWTFFDVGISPNPQVLFQPNFSALQPTVTVSRPGLYGFVLRETSPVCGVRRDTTYVYVQELQMQAQATTPTCEEVQDGQIDILTQGTQFSIDNGSTWSSSPNFSGLAAGTYNICVEDNIGCSACADIVVPTGTKISMDAGADTSICENGVASLNAVVGSNVPMTFYWNDQAQSASVVLAPSASKYHKVYAQSSNGCTTDTDSVYVEVKDAIELFVSDVQSVCPGEPTSIRVNPNGGWGTNYVFDWSNGTASMGDEGVLYLSPMSNTTVTVTVSDQCESNPVVFQIPIEVYPVPEASLSFDMVEACEPAVFGWNIETDQQTYAQSFLSIANQEPVQDRPAGLTSEMMAGTYGAFVILTNEFGCMDSLELPSALKVHELPVAHFTSKPSKPTSVNPEVSFLNFSSGGIRNDWFVNDEWISNEENPTYKFAENHVGSYEVALEVTSGFGCVSDYVQIVNVIADANVFIPNAFTPDDNQYNQYWELHADGIDEDQFRVTVYNRWGQQVWTASSPKAKWNGTFKGENLPTGIYSYTITTYNKTSGEPLNYQGTINLLR